MHHLEGKRFNNLKVIEKTEKPEHVKRNSVWWRCVCDCGKESLHTGNAIVYGHAGSCGCKRFYKERGKRNGNWKGYEEISSTFWNRVTNSAKDRGLVVEITIEQIWDLFLSQNRRCALSGIYLCFSLQGTCNGNASLDRIDNSKGYIKGNIQWVDKRVQMMKASMDEDEFIFVCKKIAKNTENRSIK